MSAARILRTRSGRELQRQEFVGKKAKQHDCPSGETDAAADLQSNISDVKTALFKSTKRKRGRPKKVPLTIRCKQTGTCDKSTTKDNSSSNFKDNDISAQLIDEQRIEHKNHVLDLFPRKKRMASLNALAKVNAVLECYRFDNKKETSNGDHKDIETSQSKQDVSIIKQLQNAEVVNEVTSDSETTPCVEQLHKQKHVPKHVQTSNEEIIVAKSDQSITVTSKILLNDKSSQTDVFHKFTQTDETECLYDPLYSMCTCNSSHSRTYLYSMPILSSSDTKQTIHVKSSSIAHCDGHSIVAPVIKQHTFVETEFIEKPVLTENVSCLVESCFANTLIKTGCPCSKLLYLSTVDEKLSLFHEQRRKKASQDLLDLCSKKSNGLLVPNLNYADISVPNSQYHHKSTKMLSTIKSSPYRKKKFRTASFQKKQCNGWEFVGEPIEETIKVGGQEIVRKFYQCLRRKGDELRIHDAVLLRSGHDRAEADYVARISALWEDTEGLHTGDMMMSVFWYYKPEQTSNKYGDCRGEEKEVFASRHQDDNSVACIVDRCFVVSFPQYCRFHAQRLVFKENRKQKLSVVPEQQSNGSRYIPCPRTDPSLVFFCRYGYDHRFGKILKTT